jgi:hypothetical protein
MFARESSPVREWELLMPPLFDQQDLQNFEIRRAFTAHQLFTILKEVSHTVLLLEHDPTLFDGADEVMPQIAGMLKDISRESLVILYAPSIDRSFSVLMRQADHIIEIVPADEIFGTAQYRSPRSRRNSEILPYAQRTLEVT